MLNLLISLKILGEVPIPLQGSGVFHLHPAPCNREELCEKPTNTSPCFDTVQPPILGGARDALHVKLALCFES